jgi:hypothetical protein
MGHYGLNSKLGQMSHALLWICLQSSSSKASVASRLLPLELPLFLFHFSVLVLNNQSLLNKKLAQNAQGNKGKQNYVRGRVNHVTAEATGSTGRIWSYLDSFIFYHIRKKIFIFYNEL